MPSGLTTRIGIQDALQARAGEPGLRPVEGARPRAVVAGKAQISMATADGLDETGVHADFKISTAWPTKEMPNC